MKFVHGIGEQWVATVGDDFYLAAPAGGDLDGEYSLTLFRSGQAKEQLGTHVNRDVAMKQAYDHYGV